MTGKKDIQKQLTFTKPIFLKVKLISSTFLQALKWRYELTHPKKKMLLKTVLFGLYQVTLKALKYLRNNALCEHF